MLWLDCSSEYEAGEKVVSEFVDRICGSTKFQQQVDCRRRYSQGKQCLSVPMPIAISTLTQ